MSDGGRPLVSIITVVRNGAAGIGRTLNRVAAQAGVLHEHLVIDGASSDGTLSILKQHRSRQLRWISEPDGGIYEAMNKAVALSRGEWLLFLGADDALADQNVLSEVLVENDLSGYDLVCGVSRFDDGRRYVSRLDWRINVFNTIHHQAAFYRRSLFDEFRYRTDIPVTADYELNYLMRRQNRIILFLDRDVSICGSRGISHTTSPFAAQYELFKARSRYINSPANCVLLSIGLANVVATRIRRLSTAPG